MTLNSRVHGHFRSPAATQTCPAKKNGVGWGRSRAMGQLLERFRLHVGSGTGILCGVRRERMITAIIRDSENDRVKGGLRF